VQFGTPTYKYCATEDGEYGTYDAVVNGQAGTWYVKGFVEATTNYAAATSDAVSFTIANATMTGITATAYSAAYDGEAHGITVTGVPDGATVTYGTTEGTYDQSENPTYTDVAAARTVYFKVSKANYSNPGNELVHRSADDNGLDLWCRCQRSYWCCCAVWQ